MRFILPLYLIIMLMPLPARAEYFVKGKVIAVDREKGEITLSTLNPPQHRPRGPMPESQKEEAKEENKEKIYIISADFIPPCADPDRIIQVWGELSSKDENRLQARRITGPGWRHGQDSTGVRMRLRRRCFMPPQPGPDEP